MPVLPRRYMQQSAMGGVNRYAEALPLLERSCEIARMGNSDEKDDDLTVAYGNLAACKKGLGQMDEAIELIKECIAMAENVKTGNSEDRVASAKHNLAVFYMDQFKWAEAEPILMEVLAIRERILPPHHPSLGQTIECVAVCLQQSGRMQVSRAPWLVRALPSRGLLGGERRSCVRSDACSVLSRRLAGVDSLREPRPPDQCRCCPARGFDPMKQPGPPAPLTAAQSAARAADCFPHANAFDSALP